VTSNAIRPTTIKIDQTTKERLKRIADVRHRTPHWMILEAIRQYVDREEKREAFRQDGIKAWNEYQSSGLHVTFEEADDWLAELEPGKDTIATVPGQSSFKSVMAAIVL
jgi:predicted transcriptional regulator